MAHTRTLFLLILLVGNACAQWPDNAVDWFVKIGVYREPVVIRNDRHPKEQTDRFHEKLNALIPSKNSSEWGGLYVDELTEVGVDHFVWRPEIGFAKYYIYTCVPELRGFDYGSVVEKPDKMLIFSQRRPALSTGASETYVKVRWSGRYYLVAEQALLAFAEKAAGIYVQPDPSDEGYDRWRNYWVKGESESDLSGLPTFPPSYRLLQRKPISTRIVSFGGRVLVPEYQFSNRVFSDESALYHVMLRDGRNKGIKEGMVFFVAGSEDEIHVTEVGDGFSKAVIVRNIDDDKHDFCLSDDGEPRTCPELRPNAKASTRTGHMYY